MSQIAESWASAAAVLSRTRNRDFQKVSERIKDSLESGRVILAIYGENNNQFTYPTVASQSVHNITTQKNSHKVKSF